jgi:hypothetical protein
MKSKKERVKNFFKPTKKKIAIAGLTAATLTGLALWDKIGYNVNIEAIGTLLPDRNPRKIIVFIQYNPVLYPISHLIGNAKEEFETTLIEYLWGIRSKQTEQIHRQFLLNIPYYLYAGYAIGCSVAEGLKDTTYSFCYAKEEVFGRIDKFLKKYIKR